MAESLLIEVLISACFSDALPLLAVCMSELGTVLATAFWSQNLHRQALRRNTVAIVVLKVIVFAFTTVKLTIITFRVCGAFETKPSLI